jgi:hypothetical protein
MKSVGNIVMASEARQSIGIYPRGRAYGKGAWIAASLCSSQ